jgi:hypothetical protein
MGKIAHVDNQAMNALLKSELARGGKVAAASDYADDMGDPQAFKDHEEYNATLEEVLKEDNTEAWPPNDPILD